MEISALRDQVSGFKDETRALQLSASFLSFLHHKRIRILGETEIKLNLTQCVAMNALSASVTTEEAKNRI